MRRRLTKRETKWREKIIVEIWVELKGNLTITELANIFKMELADAYKILRGGEDKEKIKRDQDYLNKK